MRLSLPVTAIILATATSTMPSTAEARSYGRLLTIPSHRYQYSRRPRDGIDILSDIMLLSPFFKFHQDANSLLRQHASALLSSATPTTTATAGSQLRLDDAFYSQVLGQPPYRIFENAKTGVIELNMDIPGVSAKDLSIELENDVLRISGSRMHKNLDGETTTESKFDQSFQLDNDVDPEGLEVTLSDGVLRVSAPKKEKIVKHLAIKAIDTDEDYAALETTKASDQGTVEWSMDIPGVSAKDLSIELENGSVLRIAGSRKHKNQIGETVESKFHQSFQLNNDVEAEGLEVTLSHGVLRVLAPKKEKVVKRLAIKPTEEDYVALETKLVDQEIAVGKTPTDETPVEEVIELDDEVATS